MEREIGGGHWLPPGFVAAYHDKALADEFRGSPNGPYSDRLTALLTIMRKAPVEGKPVFVLGPDGASRMAKIPRRFGDPLTVVGETFAGFPGPEQEIEAFALRWQTFFGEDLPG